MKVLAHSAAGESLAVYAQFKTPAKSTRKKMSGGAIFGVVVGVLAFCGLSAWCYVRARDEFD